jgi:hypothetical protein
LTVAVQRSVQDPFYGILDQTGNSLTKGPQNQLANCPERLALKDPHHYKWEHEVSGCSVDSSPPEDAISLLLSEGDLHHPWSPGTASAAMRAENGIDEGH